MNALTFAQTMAEYNRWMNDRLYDCCAQLSDDERKRDVGAFFKSIQGTLNHLLLGDLVWLGRFTGEPFPVKSLDQELYSDFAELRAERTAIDIFILEWVSSLSEVDFSGELSYTSIVNPKPRQYPFWFAIVHFLSRSLSWSRRSD